MKHVKLFGVELEGGWNEAPPLSDNYMEDGSVNVRGEWNVGEIVSVPMSTLRIGQKFVAENYPCHVGGTCGMHVHMSFHNNDYDIALIADSEEYQTGLFKTFKKLGEQLRVTNSHFWSRLEGENNFCTTNYAEEGVLDNERYRAVNFCSYPKHGTVEIRVLPMFQSIRLALRFMRRVLSYTEWYLKQAYKNDTEVEFECVIDDFVRDDESAVENILLEV